MEDTDRRPLIDRARGVRTLIDVASSQHEAADYIERLKFRFETISAHATEASRLAKSAQVLSSRRGTVVAEICQEVANTAELLTKLERSVRRNPRSITEDRGYSDLIGKSLIRVAEKLSSVWGQLIGDLGPFEEVCAATSQVEEAAPFRVKLEQVIGDLRSCSSELPASTDIVERVERLLRDASELRNRLACHQPPTSVRVFLDATRQGQSVSLDKLLGCEELLAWIRTHNIARSFEVRRATSANRQLRP